MLGYIVFALQKLQKWHTLTLISSITSVLKLLHCHQFASAAFLHCSSQSYDRPLCRSHEPSPGLSRWSPVQPSLKVDSLETSQVFGYSIPLDENHQLVWMNEAAPWCSIWTRWSNSPQDSSEESRPTVWRVKSSDFVMRLHKNTHLRNCQLNDELVHCPCTCRCLKNHSLTWQTDWSSNF